MDPAVGAKHATPSRVAVLASALLNQRLARLLAAFLLFNLVEWATWIAILVWAYDRGGVRGASVVALAQLVPAALVAPALSVLAGRLSRGRALSIGYTAQAVGFAACGLAIMDDRSFVVVAVLAAVAAVAVSMTRPVHYAAVPEGASTTAELSAGNAASGVAEAGAVLVGPLLCAVLITPWGPGGVVLTMGLLCLPGAALTAALGPVSRGMVAQVRAPRLREVVRDPAARVLSGLVAAGSVLVGTLDILLVMLALDRLGMAESGPAVLNAALGVGGLLGAALTVCLVGRQRLGGAVVIGGAVAGAALALGAMAAEVVVAALLVAVVGAGKAFFDVSVRTLVQRVLPERLLTAVFGVQEAMIMGGLAVGSLLAPVLVEALGERGAFVGAGCVLPVLLVAAWRTLRDVDDLAAVPADVLRLLRSVPILAVLPPRLVERLARDAVGVDAPAGTSVIVEGEAGDRFYVVVTGQAAVSMDGQEVRRIGPGGWFGEVALLHDVPRTASVSAVTDLTLRALERDSFLATVAGVPSLLAAADDHARRTYR